MLVSRIALLATAVAAAVVRRDGATPSQVMTDLAVIQSSLVNYEITVSSYNGNGLGPFTPAIFAAKTVNDALKKATDDANGVGDLSDADCQTMIDYLTNFIEPTVAVTMSILYTKKAAADANGLRELIHDNLVFLQNRAKALSLAIEASAPADKLTALNSITSKIDADFQKEVDQYSK